MAPLASAERSADRNRPRRDQGHRARCKLRTALTLIAACAAAGCDDVAPGRSPRVDAAIDAGRDAEPEDHAGGDEDAGKDAGAEPEKIVGDDYTLFPQLTPQPDGELIVRFGIPDSARSFALTVVPKTPRRVLLLSLHGPGDELLFDGLADPPTGTLAGAVTYNLEPALPFSIVYPNAPQAPFGPGIYRARLYLGEIDGDADPTASIDLVLGRPIDEAEPRVLGLQLWLAAGAVLTPDDFVADRAMLDALATLRAIYEQAGITVPDIGLDELGAPGDKLSVVDSDEVLLRILDALSGFPGRGVHIVFVDRIEAGEGKTVLGKTSGIPVPPPHDELARRGAVLVALETLPTDPARIAELIAHEAAHALGLRHTSEADGERHDALLDTPACPADRATFEITSGQLLLTAEDCDDLDGDNLLFYTPPRTGFAQQTLTVDQAWALSRSPSIL